MRTKLYAHYFARSMGKVFPVTHVTEAGSVQSDDVRIRSGNRIVVVSTFDGYDFHADRYGETFTMPGSGKLYAQVIGGRLVEVVRIFPASMDGDNDANAYMMEHPEVGALDDRDGMTLLARMDDLGVPKPRAERIA